MIKYLRFAIQLSFFIIALLVIFNLVDNYYFVGTYNSLHILTSFSTLPWLMLPVFLWTTFLMILLPFILGRLYCSYICPVGFIQDIFFNISNFLPFKKWAFRWHMIVSLSILGLASILLFRKSPLYGIFDHYTNIDRKSVV